MTAALTYSRAHRSHLCPSCGQRIVRVPRRPGDRLRSIFTPVWRFACSSRGCAWTGVVAKSALRMSFSV